MIMRDGSFVTNDYVYTKNMCYKKAQVNLLIQQFASHILKKQKQN